MTEWEFNILEDTRIVQLLRGFPERMANRTSTKLLLGLDAIMS